MRGAERVSLSEGCDRKYVPFPVPPSAILCSSENHPSLFEPFNTFLLHAFPGNSTRALSKQTIYHPAACGLGP